MMRVLIVEDEDMIRKGLVYTIAWLSMECIIVGEASNGQEGLEQMKVLQPDVVITDICMPCMDGIEMIRRASESLNFKSILLTSYADFEFARRAIEARVSEYLLKPVSEEALAEIMKRLGAEIASIRQVAYVMEQAELEGGGMNLEYYIQRDCSKNQYVSQAIEEIRAHYGEKLSMESVAEKLEVSTSYISRKFKEETGQTFLDFLNRYRVQQAIVMLNAGTYRISQISDATGFTDYKHFCSVFKKYTLQSPTKFAKGST